MISAPQPSDPAWYQKLWRVYRRLARTQDAYREIPDAVLIDLAGLCHAYAPAVTEREIGRRDVWLWIQQYREMSGEELAVLRANLTPHQRNFLWHPDQYVEEDE